MDAADSPLTPRPNDTAAHTANPWTPLPSSPGGQPGDALTRFKDLSALLLMVSLTALALLANAAVLAVIVRAPHLRKFAFVCHLCAVDLLCAALLMPLAIASGSPFFFAGGVAFSAPECRAYVFLTVLLVAASVFTVAVISVERYYYIVHPMRYEAKMTLRLAAVVMAAVWAASALLASAAVFGWPAYGGPSSVGGAADAAARRSLHCGRSSGGRRGFSILFCVACFCAPAAVMLAVYCGVYKVARGAARRHGPRPLPSWTADRPKRRSDSVNSQTAIVVTTRSAPRRRAARDTAFGGGKAALTLVVIVGQFLLCWLPYFAYHLHLTLGSASPPAGGPVHAEDAVTWLAYSSFAVNPFFYGLLNRQIREELCKLRRCCSAGRPAPAVALAASGSHDGSAAHDNFLQFLQRTGSTAETRASMAASSSTSPRSTLDQSGQASGFRIPGQIPEEAS